MNPNPKKMMVIAACLLSPSIILASNSQVSSYAPDSLLQQQSGMNEDLTLLKQASKEPALTHPHWQTSAGLEGQYFHNYSDDPKHPGDDGWALSTAEIANYIQLSPWVSAFSSIDYVTQPITTGHRDLNGSVLFKRSFVTIGNLSKTPFYLTAGRIISPFGQGSSNMLSSPAPKIMSCILSDTAVIGIQKDAINVMGFIYNNHQNKAEGGARITYTPPLANKKLTASASFVNDLSASQGMQSNGITTTGEFSGFNGQTLSKTVSGADIAVGLTEGHWSINGEYATALSSFAKTDLSMNLYAAIPRAIQVETNFNWQVGPRPWTAGIRLDHSWDSLALNIPQNGISATLSTSYWKNTKQSIELGYSHDYSKSDTANGKGAITPISGDGQNDIHLTIQTGAYW